MANSGLRFEEEQAIPRTTVPTSSPVAVLPVASEAQRYDQDMIQKALALALQMQQQHKATLTTEEVVRIGEEVDVDREFVLQALAQLAAQSPPSTASNAAQEVNVPERMRRQSRSRGRLGDVVQVQRLSRKAKVAAIAAPCLYSLFAFAIFRTHGWNEMELSRFVAFVGGPSFALVLGAMLRSKRLGLASGLTLGFTLMFAAMLDDSMNGDSLGPFLNMVGFFLAFLAVGATMGTGGAIIRKHGVRLYRRSVAALVRRFPSLADA